MLVVRRATTDEDLGHVARTVPDEVYFRGPVPNL